MLTLRNIWKFEKAGIVLGLCVGIVLGAVGMAVIVAESGITVLP